MSAGTVIFFHRFSFSSRSELRTSFPRATDSSLKGSWLYRFRYSSYASLLLVVRPGIYSLPLRIVFLEIFQTKFWKEVYVLDVGEILPIFASKTQMIWFQLALQKLSRGMGLEVWGWNTGLILIITGKCWDFGIGLNIVCLEELTNFEVTNVRSGYSLSSSKHFER